MNKGKKPSITFFGDSVPKEHEDNIKRFAKEIQDRKNKRLLGIIPLLFVIGIAWCLTNNKPEIAIVYITGKINYDQGRKINPVLSRLAQDPKTSAVILRINSTGGSGTVGYEISREVQRIKKAGKKVVASIGFQGTSAAYLIATSADKIMITPFTVTGSIGIIRTHFNREKAYKKAGIEVQVLRTGIYKAPGANGTAWTKEQLSTYEDMINECLEDAFIKPVAKARNLPIDTVRQMADGRCYMGYQAKRLKLVDEIGDQKDAIRYAAKLAGLRNYKIKYYE